MKPRLLGVTLCGVMWIVQGAVFLWNAVRFAPDMGTEKFSAAIMVALTVIGSVFMVLGIGLLMLKEWARLLTLLTLMGLFLLSTWSGVFFLFRVVATNLDQQTVTVTMILVLYLCGLVFYGLFIRYFLRPSVKAQFISRRANG